VGARSFSARQAHRPPCVHRLVLELCRHRRCGRLVSSHSASTQDTCSASNSVGATPCRLTIAWTTRTSCARLANSRAVCSRLTRNVRCHMRWFLPITLIGLLAASNAMACGCDRQTSKSHPHVDQLADAIFVGEVAEVSGPDSSGVVLVRFKIVESRRGAQGKFITIEVHNRGNSCDLEPASFRIREKYLMSGNQVVSAASDSGTAKEELQIAPRYFNNYCGLRERVPD
jgi:hypothetical protein